MNELTQLERARAVVDAFVPQDKPGNHYVYAYLGKASYDATQYEFIDGLCLASKRIWHLDESQADCVAYIGQGVNDRLNDVGFHPVFPSAHLRIKVQSDLSSKDSVDLEKQIIAELGHILDTKNLPGCLVNMRRWQSGEFVCPLLEAASFKREASRSTEASSKSCSIPRVAYLQDRTVVATGSGTYLAQYFNFSAGNISACCTGIKSGIYSPTLGQAVYFCYLDDFPNASPRLMTNLCHQAHRVLVASKLDGSDRFVGTAKEIAMYAGLTKSSYLHSVARGRQRSCSGWTARYVDELEAPVATYGPNLSAFF